KNSVVLFSTRLPLLARELAATPDAVYILSGLESPFDLELLASFAPDAVKAYGDLCDDLVKSVGGLPLAIVVAGKMLQREHAAGGDVQELLETIREDARKLLTQPVPPDMADLLNQTTPDVVAVLRRSTSSLSQELKEQFAKLGTYPATPGVFPLRMVARTWKLPPEEAKATARKFVDLGLINVAKRGHYQIHPLIRALALFEWDQFHEKRKS
ncbi:MAG: hypothetical protein JWM11_7775, partial [Planctomycetaceae bacterium]|nr:hypothetical protein [Planctomycetaceae bacterium]